jgi:anti-sigma regulatory factor (Ser/Thr protein kinase)
MYEQVGELALDVQVVVSELVTNAVRAQCRHLTLVLEGHHRYLRVAATDDAPGTPVKQTPTPDQTHGRGLCVVDALSSRWGVEVADGDKTVWAEVPVSPDVGPTFACAV